MSNADEGTAIENVRNAQPKLFGDAGRMLPQMTAELSRLYGPAITVETASGHQLGQALADVWVQFEFAGFLNQTDTDISTTAGRTIALDVFTSAINCTS